MSGSDKQTYYKMGTSPSTPDTAEQFAKSLTAAGCTHEDLVRRRGIGSLRGFITLCGRACHSRTIGSARSWVQDRP